MLQTPTWVGLENYIRLFTDDPVFVLSLKNTFYFSIITGPLGFFLSLFLAWLIDETRSLRKAFTFAFYIPSMTSAVALSVVWLYVFAADKYGFLNYFLAKWGIITQPIIWLRDTRTTLLCIMIVSLWMSMGVGFLVFTAALQGVPKELKESGMIDGANKLQQFIYITIPILKPALLFGAVMATVNSFQIFDLAQILAGFPSVLYSAHTIVAHLYDYAFIRFEMGYAAAVSVLLFLITMIISRVMMRLLSSRDA
jgi:multiple sugar transport system permease protein